MEGALLNGLTFQAVLWCALGLSTHVAPRSKLWLDSPACVSSQPAPVHQAGRLHSCLPDGLLSILPASASVFLAPLQDQDVYCTVLVHSIHLDAGCALYCEELLKCCHEAAVNRL